MGQKLGDDNIPKLVVASTTTATLAITNGGQPTLCTIAGQQYSPASLLTLNAATVGANGLDAGALGASQLWYVYAIANQSTFAMALVASLSATPTMPSGYGTAYKLIGGFSTNASSQISLTVTIAQISSAVYTISPPNVQTFLSGSGTYTTPANAIWLSVRMVGGGGGGAGGGLSPTNGAVGVASTFGTSLLVANGGNFGQPFGTNTGGTASKGTAVGLALTGGGGSGATRNSSSGLLTPNGGIGASTPFGGSGGSANNSSGSAGAVNTGAGGGGGGAASNDAYAVSGGAASGYVDAIISAPLPSYSYVVGTGGSGGGASSGGYSGGAGGSGVIIVTAYFALGAI